MMTTQRFFGICALTVSLVLSLTGCGRGELAPLPQGIQDVSGVLSPVSLSIARRGTHVLSQDGKQVCFVESNAVSLLTLEGRQVALRGTFEPNLDPHNLPVLKVTEVVSGDAVLKLVSVPSLQLKLSVPGDWQMQGGGGTRFTASGGALPILLIQQSAVTTIPEGDSIIIGGAHAVMLTLGDTDRIAYVDRGNSTITSFAYTPPIPIGDDSLFRHILNSVTFDISIPSSSASGTGTSLGQPCGGSAGILCPTGEYCEVTDAVTDIGRCAKL